MGFWGAASIAKMEAPATSTWYRGNSNSVMVALAALGVLLASHTSLLALLESYMHYSQSMYVLVGLLVLPAGRAVFTISSPRASSAGAKPELTDDPASAAHTTPGTAGNGEHDPSSACSSSSVGSINSQQGHGHRRRRIIPGVRAPRVSIQLTPLPRVILEFEHGGGRRRRSSDASRPQRWQAGGHPRQLDADALGELPEALPSPSLRSALQRQASWGGQRGCGEQQAGSAGSYTCGPFGAAAAREIEAAGGVVVDGRELCGVIAAPCEATACLGTDDLPADCGPAVAASVSETHLLQFGAMLGEGSCREALARAEAAGPVGSSAASLYGSPDTDGFYGPWEPVVQETAPGLLYWGWRRPLRKGLYMYMTRSVFLGVTPAEMRAFMMDDACRLQWDRSMTALGPALRSLRGVCAPQRETDVLYAAVKFPKPLAQRSYVYARRIWARPSDGGCYVIARGCAPPAGAAAPPRGVAVTDYSSGAVIRAPAAALLGGHAGSASEVLMIYFEDSHVRAGFANLGIKKGLWPMLQRTDRAVRSYLRNGGTVGLDGGASVPATPHCGSAAGGAAASCGDAAGGGASGSRWRFSSSTGASWLRAVAQSLRALAAAAGALWEAHARVASLLPRMELRVLRWLLGRVPYYSGSSSSSGPGGGALLRGTTGARLPPLPPAIAGGRARSAGGRPAQPQPSPRLHRVNSHPLVDDSPSSSALNQQQQQQAAASVRSATPSTPRLQVRINTPEQQVQRQPSLGSPLVRVGSFPLALDDEFEADDDHMPETPQASVNSCSAATAPPGRRATLQRLGSSPLPPPGPSGHRAASAQQPPQLLRRTCSCGSETQPALSEDWPVARYVAAAAFETRSAAGSSSGRGGRSHSSAAAAAPRPAYAASCPAGSYAGSDASGPVSSVGGRSCGRCHARGSTRRRAKGRLVVRLIQTAGARVANRLTSSLSQGGEASYAAGDADGM